MSDTRKILNEVAKPFFGGKIHIVPATEVKVGTTINTPAGFKTVASVEPDDERGGQLIYYRCTDNSLWCADPDGDVETKAPTTEAKSPAYNPAPGEVHVPRDFERKRPKHRPKTPRTIELARLAPPSEQGNMPQVGGRVRFPGSKRATVIHDPLTDRIKRKVEMHLGDVVENPDDEAAVSEEAWTLAIDAAHEVGIEGDRAIRVAKDVCRLLGYPRK